jgi:hypothetical protein
LEEFVFARGTSETTKQQRRKLPKDGRGKEEIMTNKTPEFVSICVKACFLFLARALPAAITFLVTPFAFGTATPEYLLLLVAATAGLLIEAMSNVCYLTPASRDAVDDLLMPEGQHSSWLWWEAQEVACIAGKFERGQISATWANLQIGGIVWYARHRPMPPATSAETCKPERVAETCPDDLRRGPDDLKRLEDLKRRLDRLEEARGYVRPPRPDPPVMQTPPEYVLRYPAPEAMRNIRARRFLSAVR